MDMNSTAAARAARDSLVADAMRDLEGDVCSVLIMARILADLLENELVGFENGEKIHMPEQGKSMNVILTHDQLEMLSFAWNDVIERALRLKKRFYAAHQAGVPA